MFPSTNVAPDTEEPIGVTSTARNPDASCTWTQNPSRVSTTATVGTLRLSRVRDPRSTPEISGTPEVPDMGDSGSPLDASPVETSISSSEPRTSPDTARESSTGIVSSRPVPATSNTNGPYRSISSGSSWSISILADAISVAPTRTGDAGPGKPLSFLDQYSSHTDFWDGKPYDVARSNSVTSSRPIRRLKAPTALSVSESK